MNKNWQKIEEGELKHSSAHHLMAIHYLIREQGYARITDISKYLNITRGSVSITLNRIKDNGFIEFDKNKHITLTGKGMELVETILKKREAVQKFFSTCLFIDQKEAGECACKLEHIISLSVIKKLDRFTDFFSHNLADEQTLDKLKEKLAKP